MVRLRGDVRGQPVAVLVQEAFAGDQAGAQRQAQARTALVERQLDPPRARVAHAQHVDAAAIGQHEGNAVALDGRRLRCGAGRGEQAEQRMHGVIFA